METKTTKAIGNKLKTAREKAKLTQAEVADKAGINANYYSRVERGEEQAALDTLDILSKILKVKLFNY